MSQAGILNVAGGGGGGTPVQTLTGNSGGAVPPTANNINVIGAGGVLVTGNPGTSTLTITSGDNFLTGTATTTGFTTANINVNIPIPTNSTTSIRANIAGYDSTPVTPLATGGELIGLAKNISGVVTIVGVPDRTKNNDAALSDTNWTLVVSGTNVLVQVTGTANAPGSDVINWRAIIDLVSAP